MMIEVEQSFYNKTGRRNNKSGRGHETAHGPPSPPGPPGFDIPAMVLPSCINRRMRQDLFPPFNARFALIFAYQIKMAENCKTKIKTPCLIDSKGGLISERFSLWLKSAKQSC